MNLSLLADLVDLFTLEALEADDRGDHIEAGRLWGIAEEVHERFMRTEEST